MLRLRAGGYLSLARECNARDQWQRATAMFEHAGALLGRLGEDDSPLHVDYELAYAEVVASKVLGVTGMNDLKRFNTLYRYLLETLAKGEERHPFAAVKMLKATEEVLAKVDLPSRTSFLNHLEVVGFRFK